MLDERYLFAGANFLIFLAYAAAANVFIALALAATVYGFYRLLTLLTTWRPIAEFASLGHWISAPLRLALTGLALSAAFFFLVMTSCLEFSNILLREKLPKSYLRDWLLQEGPCSQPITWYIIGMVGVAMVASVVLLKLHSEKPRTMMSVGIRHLLAFFVAMLWLMLPVNYGCLFMNKRIPKVIHLENTIPIAQGKEVWLVWESKDNLTFLLSSGNPKTGGRSLLTISRDQVKTVEVITYDPLFPTLFGPQQQDKNCDQKK